MATGRSNSIHSQSVTRPLMMMCMGMAGLLLYLQSRAPLPPSAPAMVAAVHQSVPVAETVWGDRAEDTSLMVDLSDRTVYLYRNQKLMASYRVAVGQPGWETPVGSFRIRQMVKNPVWQHPITDQVFPPGGINPLGVRWIGFAADQHMKLGFHGTTSENAIGQAVSHGCLRMKNRDVTALFSQVSLGTVVTVRP
ncbi:MAG: L,D-transpeptidase family protein [Alkalinema sp. CAN_BIN05]|nr:L,D-transpeptidase family protein [Alkalinema sp. CAN_BIN05]